jgi:hypothetical protein
MRHFAHLPEADLTRLFHCFPQSFTVDDESKLLATALGATLYSPATRSTLAADIAKGSAQGVISTVVCLEDSVADGDLPGAELNAVEQLRAVAATEPSTPMVFVRVRNVEQIHTLANGLREHPRVLTGFVIRSSPRTAAHPSWTRSPMPALPSVIASS